MHKRTRAGALFIFTVTELTIGFSASFLIEILNTLHGEEVVVNLGDAIASRSVPGLREEPDNTELVMLLMPMTVGEF